MSDNSVPLTVVSGAGRTNPWGQIALGSNVMSQNPKQRGFWIVAIDRATLKIVYNQVQTDPSAAPDLGVFNTADYVLAMASLGMGLDRQPQGSLFSFLDKNGAGRELRRVAQVASQLNCGALGTYGYALVSLLGNTNPRGFEISQLSTEHATILTVQMQPATIGTKTIYTPVQLSNA
jgi:hypothetical protein